MSGKPASGRPPRPASAGQEEARRVLQVEAQAILNLLDRLDSSFDAAVDLLESCHGRVVTTGMGKSGIIARKLAATFSSTGTPALFLHPAEAVHGDLGGVVKGDLLIALSHSGETGEIARIVDVIKRLGVPLIALAGRPTSTLARIADVFLDVGVQAEACPLGLAPTASTTAALAMGDALAMSLQTRKGFKVEDFAAVHPAGLLGTRLRRVADLMHHGDTLPMVAPDTPLDQVISSMTRGRLGMTVVVHPDQRLAGIVTDGDLRRLLQGGMEESTGAMMRRPASACMTATPRTIGTGALASEALHLMESHKITCLVVMDGERVAGAVHLHDLWRMDMI